MKKIVLFSLISVLYISAVSQVAPDKYFVAFTDKDNSPYSISNPSEYLSQRAIDRRSKQSISIDMKDIPVNPAYIQGVRQVGVEILNPTKWLNGVTIETNDPNKINTIMALPYVKNVMKSVVTLKDTKSEKPFFRNESYNIPWNGNTNSSLNRSYDYGPSYNQIHMLNGDLLHDMGYRGQGMLIAVLDAGFEDADNMIAFDSLWMNGQILGTWDFVAGNEVTFNRHTHGSMVLSTMGANVPGTIIGTAPLADYWLLRSEDGATEYIVEEYNWVSAAEFADSVGADVINSSLGYTEFDDPSQNHTYQDMDGNTTPVTIGADVAASRGIAVVNSAGNEGNSSWHYLIAPSDGDSVICVGAVNAAGDYVSFSSRGPSSDGRIKPNVAAQGSNSYLAYPYGGYGGGSGTSFSSPITAGMVACLWQANPNMTNMEILNAMQKSGSQASAPDDYLGYGIPDYALANNILTIIDSKSDIADENINVYPNPFRDNFYIELDDISQEVLKVQIFDNLGRVIKEIQINDNNGLIEISNLSSLQEGVYIVRVISDQYVSSRKLIKQ